MNKTKKDITTRKDIEVLINAFYDKVKADDTIGHIFTDIAKVDWPSHLPIMYDFWEGIIFGKGPYKGNPMTTHIQLNQKIRLEAHHFDRWKKLFTETLDQFFEGEKTDEVKLRMNNIANLMEHKVRTTTVQ